MLAGTVVVQRRGQLPGACQRDCRVVIARPMRPAFQRALIQAGSGEHRSRQFDMAGLAPVRGAGERQFLVAETQRIRGAAFHKRQRLDRLHRRAREDRPCDIADLQQRPACRVADCYRATMRALDTVAAKNFDEDGIGHGAASA